MRRARRKILGTIAVLGAALAVFLVPTIWFKPWSIDHYYARVFIEYAVRDPTRIPGLGTLDGKPLDLYSHKLDDSAPELEQKEPPFLDRQIAILHSYDRTRLRPKERLSYDVLDWFLTDQQQNNRF